MSHHRRRLCDCLGLSLLIHAWEGVWNQALQGLLFPCTEESGEPPPPVEESTWSAWVWALHYRVGMPVE